MGTGRGLRRVQLRPIQLADLRIRAEAKRGAVSFAGFERAPWRYAAAWSYATAATDAEADEEALSRTGIRP